MLIGVLLTTGGLFGVWLQGLFYRGGFPTPATFGEVRAAFTWPAMFTALGSLMVAGVLLASSLTTAWSARRKLVALFVFAVFVVLGCVLCGHLAAVRVAGLLN